MNTTPHAPEAEEAVLGALLIDPRCAFDVLPALDASRFYIQKNRWVYESIQRIYERGDSLDFLTLTNDLAAHAHLEAVGGAAYVSALINAVPSAINVMNYAKQITDAATRRELLDYASEVARLAYDTKRAVGDVATSVVAGALRFDGAANDATTRHIADVLNDVYSQIEAAHSTGAALTPTGYRDLDAVIGGLRPGALYTVGASTGEGKTALLLNLATRQTKREKTALFFSLEMAAESLAERLVAMDAGVSLVALSSGQLTDSDWPCVAEAMGRQAAQPLWIDDTPAITVETLRARVKSFAARQPLDVVFVDYIQIARLGEALGGRKRYLEVSLIAQSLKRLAREQGIPVVMAAQLSRARQQRQDKRPELSDLGESSGIEQNSDCVLLIQREKSGARNSPAELIVAKNRNGPTGSVPLVWMGNRVSFVEAAKTVEAADG